MVISVLVALAVILLPVLKASRRLPSRISCANNVKQILLTFRTWSQDHNDLLPMQVSVANGGAMELAATGNIAAIFQVMSNELTTPWLLHCSSDEQHSSTRNFTDLAAANISYFVGLDAGMTNSGKVFLLGDANLTLRGKPVKSGLLNLDSNAPVAWDASRAGQHRDSGNLGFADGSVKALKRFEFTNCLIKTGLATNRLAIP